MGEFVNLTSPEGQSLYRALFAPEQPKVVSFVGAGGKTSAITTLGYELTAAGHRVLITTTTHMNPPREEKLLAGSLPEAKALLQREGIAWLGERISPGKIAPTGDSVEEMRAVSEYVLVEADGARRLPLKMIDASHEPVIPGGSEAVVAVAGLDCLHRPVSEVVHRQELAEEALQVSPDHLVTPKDVAKLLSLCYDPSYVLLNKADTSKRRTLAEEIARELPKARVLAVSLKDWGQVESAAGKVFA